MGNIKTQISRHAPRTLGDLQISGSLLIYGQAFNQKFGTGRDRYVTSGEMAAAAGATSPGGADGNVQYNDGGNFGGETALRWNKTTDTFTISGATRIHGQIDARDAEFFYGMSVYPQGSAGGLNYYLYGSGYFQGTALHYRLQNSPSRDQWVDLPALFDAGVQISGAPLVAFRPMYATNQTAAGRYITSGELSTGGATSPALPFGSLQFNNAGSFGGDADLRWDSTAMLFTVSGFGFRVEAPTVYRTGADVQVSGAQVVYDRQQVGRTNLNDLVVNASSRGQVFGGHGADTTGWGWAITGSGVIRGHVQFIGLDTNVGVPFDHVDFGLPVVFHARAPIQISGNLGGAPGVLTYQPMYASPQSGATRYVTSGEMPGSPFGNIQLSGTTLTYRPIYASPLSGATRYVTSGELQSPGGADGDIQFNSAEIFGGGNRLRWDGQELRVSGFLTVANTAYLNGIVYATQRIEVGASPSSRYQTLWGDSSSLWDYELVGSGSISGPLTFSKRVGESAREFVRFRIPVVFDAAQSGLQLSGVTVAYQPIYATSQAAAARYVTSGELAATAPASPTGSVQFNNGGVFGGDVDLRWNGTTGTLTVSGVSHLVGATQIRGNAQITENLSVSADLSGSDTSRSQYFWGATGIAGVEYELYGSGIVNGAVAFGSRWASESMQFALPVRFTSAAPIQLSGTTVAYRPMYATNQTAAGRYVTSGEMSAGTPAGSDGDIQFNSSGAFGANANARLRWDETATTLAVSGTVRSYGLFFQSSDATGGGMRLRSQNGNTWELGTGTARAFGADWFLAGSGMLFGADINFGGAGAVPASKIRGNIQSTAQFQLSGVTLGYSPIYANSQTGPQRYVTSGELGAASPANPTGSVQFNNAGVFGGDNDLRYNASTSTLTVSGVAHIIGATQIRGNAQITENLSVSADLSGSDTSRSQYFWGATGIAGVEYELYGSGIVNGAVAFSSRWAGETTQFALPVRFTSAGPLQLSGEVRSYRTHAFGNTASRGGTRVSVDGDVQVSGTLRLYSGAQVTGNIDLNNWNIVNANSVLTNTVISPTYVATDTLFSSATTLINVSSNAITAAALQISGAALAYVPLHQGAATGDTRYLTSGELRPVVSTLYTTGAEVLAGGYVRSNLMVSTTLASSMLWPENGIAFDVMGAMSPGNNSIGLNVMGVVVHLGGQLLLSGSLVTTSGMYAVRTEGSVHALAQNGRQVSSVKNGWWGPNATAVSGVAMQTVGPAQERSTVNHYLVISPTQNPTLEVSYILISGGLGVYQVFGRTVYSRVTRLPTR